MDCHYCNGNDSIEEEVTLLSACEAPNPFLVENVPTFLCSLCGDKSYSSKTLVSLDRIRKGEAQASSIRAVLVFDFQDLDGQAGSVFHYGDYKAVAWSMIHRDIRAVQRTAMGPDEYYLTTSPYMVGVQTFNMWAGSAATTTRFLGQPIGQMSNP